MMLIMTVIMAIGWLFKEIFDAFVEDADAAIDSAAAAAVWHCGHSGCQTIQD
jgi:hypothetical protein